MLLAGGLAQAAPAADGWAFWAVSDPASERVVNHEAWQQVLDQGLRTTDGSGIYRFDYRGTGPAARQQLAGYLTALQDIDPRTLTRGEQLAYWINLYNAATVQVVLENPTRDSIRQMGRGWFSAGPWDDERLRIAGQRLTLNDIEHRILRPFWHDRRIHFVVNCASLGCPNLAAEAFTAGNAERLMAAGERAYLNHPRGVALEAGQLLLSSIFQWYGGDFPAGEQLLVYLAERITNPLLADQVRGYRGPISYRYDWRLNQP